MSAMGRRSVAVGMLLGLLGACSVYDPSLLPTEPPKPSPAAGSGSGNGGSAGTTDPSGGQGGTDGGEGGTPPVVVGGIGGSGDVPTGGTGGASGSGGVGGAGGNGGGDVPTATCGDGRLAQTELCDTGISVGNPGACPLECMPAGECLPQVLTGEGCSATCVPTPPDCMDDDDCCPMGCMHADDNDCSQSCGDGVVQASEGETCEPDAETDPCPTDCDDDDACTVDVLSGSPDTCNAMCEHVNLGAAPNDGCCPTGANANTDNDCVPDCGNGIKEGTEECDGSLGCDDECVLTVTAEQLECLELAAEDSVDPACTDCACLQCTQLAHDCLFEADTARAALCLDMIECGLVNDCAGTPCYCGPDLVLCGGILGRPTGPCVYEVEDASGGTTDPLIILQRVTDINYAVGRAFALADCAVQQCGDVCP